MLEENHLPQAFARYPFGMIVEVISYDHFDATARVVLGDHTTRRWIATIKIHDTLIIRPTVTENK